METPNNDVINPEQEDIYEDLIIVPDDELMITTHDNPYNPKEDYDKWRNWDREHDYYTEELVAQIASIPYYVEDPVTTQRMANDAMMFIVENDSMNIYRLI